MFRIGYLGFDHRRGEHTFGLIEGVNGTIVKLLTADELNQVGIEAFDNGLETSLILGRDRRFLLREKECS